MKRLGLYREFEKEKNYLPSIFDNLGKMPQDKILPITKYLESGICILSVMGDTTDPINKTEVITGGPSLLCDGNWVWRVDLSYFVKKHKLGLPEEFIIHVELFKTINQNQKLSKNQRHKALKAHFWK